MWAFENVTDELRIFSGLAIIGISIVTGLILLSDYIKSKRKPKL